MEIPTYFSDFLRQISPDRSERAEYQEQHSFLSDLIKNDEDLKDCIVSTFLQGSYKRGTLVLPEVGKNADVDVVVVTRFSEGDTTPDQALKAFIPFLEKHYKGKYKLQGRSIGISLPKVDLDLVVTSAPSESQIGILQSDAVLNNDTIDEIDDWRLIPSWVSPSKREGLDLDTFFKSLKEEADWKLEPLRIPDREVMIWRSTHPLEQIKWTSNKNKNTNGYYTQVVKVIKWLRQNDPEMPKYPKGYPLEHLVGYCCPDGITSVAEGVTLTLERMASIFRAYAESNQTPQLPDHGVPEHDVMRRITGEEFAQFHNKIVKVAKSAREALDSDSIEDSANSWRRIFGDDFPGPPGGGGNDKNGTPPKPRGGGYTERVAPTVIAGGRFGRKCF